MIAALRDRFVRWLCAPQPIARLSFLRISLPLAILAFMASRILHADHWIGDAGFEVPDLGGDRRQPFFLPRLPSAAAWGLVTVMVGSGLALAAGFRTRIAGLLFASTLLYVALADRLAAFTVSKLAPVLVLALALSAAGERHGVDAWLRRRRDPAAVAPDLVSWGNVRFFQALILVFYPASGLCKLRGDWLDRHDVLWTHLHDSYQTPISLWLANHLPAMSWGALQMSTLAFEVLAPIWFATRYTRPLALTYGVTMHLMIGLMFGPVVWFSLLMISLLAGGFLPARWLERVLPGRLA